MGENVQIKLASAAPGAHLPPIEYRLGSPAFRLELQNSGSGSAFDPLRKFDLRAHCGPVSTTSGKGQSMTTGTVKWFNGQKGFGFIHPESGGGDVFVHISAVERAGMVSLHEGQKLGYELERDQRNGKMSAGQLQSV